MNLDFIEKHTWYRQGADVTLFFIIEPFRAAINNFGKGNAIMVQKGIQHKGYWAIEPFISKGKQIFSIQKKDRSFIDKYIKKWITTRGKLNDLYEKFSDTIKTMTKEEFLKFVEEMAIIRFNLWNNAFYLEYFDVLDLTLLEKEVIDINFGKKDFNNLLSIEKKSPYMEIELLGDKDSFEDYFYIENDWQHTQVLGKDYFDKKRASITDERINFIEEFEENRQKEIKELENKYNLTEEVKNLFYFFRQLAYFRDLRKLQMQKSNHYLDLILKRTSRELKISYDDLTYFSPREILELYGGKTEVLKDIPKRKEWNALIMEDKNMKIYSGTDAEEISLTIEKRFQEQFKEIKGKTGSLGKAKGKVKVILGRREFNKFEEGDIIVAPMTRPEYVPLMRKASAIITDEGGVTSHAAIVSRELGIPCIIGTQVATELLKDDELVEVDADKGVVRKIE